MLGFQHLTSDLQEYSGTPGCVLKKIGQSLIMVNILFALVLTSSCHFGVSDLLKSTILKQSLQNNDLSYYLKNPRGKLETSI